jgi:alkanesulfonate monooxygenase SsuD/methylene tetrahydromethanopterin reductase-like flavin-dependent oxidoreductase (luciferase family)
MLRFILQYPEIKSEYFALGVDFDECNALFDEVLDVLPLHWAGEPFSYAGRHFDARDVVVRDYIEAFGATYLR